MNAPLAAKILIPCDKCEGKGYINGFNHYANGVCFQCAGNGTCEHTPYQQKMTAEMEKARILTDARRAFVESHKGMTQAQITAKFGALGFDKVWALHGFVSGMVVDGDDSLRPMLKVITRIMERHVIA